MLIAEQLKIEILSVNESSIKLPVPPVSGRLTDDIRKFLLSTPAAAAVLNPHTYLTFPNNGPFTTKIFTSYARTANDAYLN